MSMSTSRRPSSSMIVALVALFVALGGTGYAAATISGKSLKKRSVPADRVVNNALSGAQINESLLGPVPNAQNANEAVHAQRADKAQSADSAINASEALHAKTADTATTAKTADDAKLLQGLPSSAFLSNSVKVRVASTGNAVPGNEYPVGVKAKCLAGEKGIGGGAGWYVLVNGTFSVSEMNLPITASVPEMSGDTIVGWEAHGRNMSGLDRYLRAYVVCVPAAA